MNPCTVIVFARRPRGGRVKRRLARAAGRRRARRCYARTLARMLDEVEALRGVRRVLMPAAAADVAWFRARLRGRPWQVRAQARGDLGQRMASALSAALARGGHAILVGSDILDGAAHDLAQACGALAGGAGVVVGTARDGGYWLIGLAAPCAVLFHGMPWSTAAVSALTVARARAAGRRVATLAPRHDLDHGRDLLGAAARRCFARPQRRRARWRSSRAT